MWDKRRLNWIKSNLSCRRLSRDLKLNIISVTIFHKSSNNSKTAKKKKIEIFWCEPPHDLFLHYTSFRKNIIRLINALLAINIPNWNRIHLCRQVIQSDEFPLLFQWKFSIVMKLFTSIAMIKKHLMHLL